MLYARVYDPTLAGGRGGYRRISLGHRDRYQATTYALEQAALLRTGLAEVQQAKLTLARLCALYVRHESPKKSAGQREADARKVRLWTRWLGGMKDPHHITRREWEGFIASRGSGAIDGNGNAVLEEDRRSVGTRVVEIDLVWLKAVLNWAMSWEEQPGHRLLRENPVRGFQVPREENPRRPVASDDRYEATRAVSDTIMMRLRAAGKQQLQRSYVSEILEIANGTARRISAICQLRYEDLLLTPHRALRMARSVGPGPLTRRAAPGPLRSQLPFEGPSSASYASGRESGRPTCFRHQSIRHARSTTGSPRSGCFGPSDLPVSPS